MARVVKSRSVRAADGATLLNPVLIVLVLCYEKTEQFYTACSLISLKMR